MRVQFFVVLLSASALLLSAPGCHVGDSPEADAGIPDLPDEDGDGIADVHEGRADNVDTDGDGTPDYLDDDSDGDGIPDADEAGDDLSGTPPRDADGDGTPDFRDLDSDDNGRDDGVDGTADLDGDGIGNFADLDDDGDGILDTTELGPDPAAPVDSDGDGLADFQDTDSDADTILDLHEGIADPDDDGVPAYLDDDSDGDCILDSVEAGDDDLNTIPLDSDGDGRFNFLDTDSDNDGLADGAEDLNCNGIADDGESSATDSDTDGDGASDLVEDAAGTDPLDPADNPTANGDFVFEVPYERQPNPLEDTLDFSTSISQADVVFGMDTTGSMGGEISNLKSSLVTLINAIRADIPDTGFGVVGYDDFPVSPYGSAGSGDTAFYLNHRVMTTNTAPGLASVEAAVNAYATHFGSDGPESGWEMLYQIATGAGRSGGGLPASANVAPFDAATAHPVPPAMTDELIGEIGGVGFRAGSLPIIVWITDANSHNTIGGSVDYSFDAATDETAIAALLSRRARVIGVVSGFSGQADVGSAVDATHAVVPPSAWGPAGSRPASCAVGQCCTGSNGVGQPTNAGGACPLLFSIGGDGSGLGTAVAQAVKVLTNFGIFDIGADPRDDPSDAVDAVAAFVDRVEANTTAGAPCTAGLVAIDTNSDGVQDTFDDVTPGTTVCFDVIPKTNTTVPPTDAPQMFRATLVVDGDGVTMLDERDIFFIVPPRVPGGID